MTNREYLTTLSDYELSAFIINTLPLIWRGYNNSIAGLEKWFGEERREDVEIH